MELVEKTRRFRKKDVIDIIEDAKSLDDAGPLPESAEVDPAPAPELELFEERRSSGRWDVSELMAGADDIDDDEGGEDAKPK
jgi:hypothetical protein